MTTTSASATIEGSPLRRLSAALYRRPRLGLGALLTPPPPWLVGIYLGSLALPSLPPLWHLDPVAGIVREPSLANFQEVFSPDKPYLRVAQHTVGLAVIVTLADAL